MPSWRVLTQHGDAQVQETGGEFVEEGRAVEISAGAVEESNGIGGDGGASAGRRCLQTVQTKAVASRGLHQLFVASRQYIAEVEVESPKSKVHSKVQSRGRNPPGSQMEFGNEGIARWTLDLGLWTWTLELLQRVPPPQPDAEHQIDPMHRREGPRT